ncbi:hypothetical protein [Telmatospirillum sp. J64-1]|uniref:hypothetical protein n=1 Tax=Telmatospirillum sp. J64-1 TaxID=2502183 RepID=UPI00115ED6F0|nr:hypothetical protein [Telmatospirillum sp. J64-1]
MRSVVADSLNNIPSYHVANATFALIDRLQSDQRPGLHIATAAALFLLICERYGVSAQDAFTVTKNLMNDADNRLVPQFAAIRQYLANELA